MSGEGPVFSRRDRANALMIGAGLVALGAWHLAVWVTSDGLAITDVGATIGALVRARPLTGVGGVRAAPAWVTVTVWLVSLVVVCGGWVWASATRAARARDRASGLATARQLTRRVSRGHQVAVGSPIASHAGRPVRVRHEDTVVVIAGPRVGKTAFLAVAAVLDAPGAVVATSTKVDLVRLTVAQRRAAGAVHVFDPERVMSWPAPARWDIVAGCEQVREASVRARAMVAAKPLGGARGADFFAEAADTVLRCLLHAAALDGRSMRDVLTWARDFTNEAPYTILATHPQAAPGWEDDLRKFCRGAAHETVSSTDMSLGLVLKPLSDPAVLDLVCPPGGLGFDVCAFVNSTDTLYLLSEGGEHGSSAPLLTALAATIEHTARRASQRTAAGRLTPPMTLVLDEVANIAPLPNLASLMSDGGGRGVITWAMFQAPAQMRARWGPEGADTIWGAAAAKVVFGGLADVDFLGKVSQLVGDRRTGRTSHTLDSAGTTSSSQLSTETERKLSIETLRELPEGKALLLYREVPGAIVDLLPWWQRQDADAIKKGQAWSLAQEGLQ